MSETRQQKVDRLTQEGNLLLGKARQLLEEERDEVARPALRKMLGKCFRYTNSYSATEKWPLYAKIVAFDEQGMSFTVVQLEHTAKKELQIRYERSYNYQGQTRYHVENGWMPISTADYERECRKMLAFATELLAK